VSTSDEGVEGLSIPYRMLARWQAGITHGVLPTGGGEKADALSDLKLSRRLSRSENYTVTGTDPWDSCFSFSNPVFFLFMLLHLSFVSCPVW
jgi:hypothetical protein